MLFHLLKISYFPEQKTLKRKNTPYKYAIVKSCLDIFEGFLKNIV